MDTALNRGRCGLWDWDLARGRLYWSDSMFEILGLTPREELLSFGEVDALVHPDDGSLYGWHRILPTLRMGRSTAPFACVTPTATGCGCARAPNW
jgi:PAS domain-containing protein